MDSPIHSFIDVAGRKPRAAVFLSGSGSNAERLLEREAAAGQPAYTIAALVTDAPEASRAALLARNFGKPLIALDIRHFYRDRGAATISLATGEGRAIREEWTAELRRRLAPVAPDFGILAGFVPLTNLTRDFPCLNVHPGDLTEVDAAGRRILVGLHTVPVELALCAGLPALRSSVILALSYSGAGGDMDSGPLLGISPPMAVDFEGFSSAGLAAVREGRAKPRTPDALSELAVRHQERLKIHGDWVVLPPAADDFARGCFGHAGEALYWREAPGAPWLAIRTVEYRPDGSRRILPA